MVTIPWLYSIYQQHPLISTDSRAVKPGSVFFALKGENFNGNCFAEQALASGAAYAVVDESEYATGEKYILTDDVLKTLQQLACFHRKKTGVTVIGITGSNGKTTTKELVKAVLETKYKTAATAGNLNNHIGVPLTLLALPYDTQTAVIEMGANHQGEIALLCEIACPDYGLITNVGNAHLDGFGGFEGVKKAKGELYRYLQNHNGTAFINADNFHLHEMSMHLQKTIKYGITDNAGCTGTLHETNPFISFRWKTRLTDYSDIINTKLTGKYNFENLMAAVCIGNHFKVSPQNIRKAIENFVPSGNRSQIIRLKSNVFLADAYNANPTSMEAALTSFAELKTSVLFSSHQGKKEEHTQKENLFTAKGKIVILGDMMELGKDTEKEHARIVSVLKNFHFEMVILVGENFGKVKNNADCLHFRQTDELCVWLKKQQFSNTCFLIKGSRKMHLEKVMECF